MKKIQTFKFDPELLDALKKEAGCNFNRYVENLLKTHPKMKKYNLWKLG